MTRRRRVAVSLGTVLFACLVSVEAGAVQSKCLALKNKCMSKKAGSLLKCEEKAETPGAVVEPALTDCINKADAKFQGIPDPTKGCFEKLENNPTNDCISFNDTASAEQAVDDCVDQLVSAIDPPPRDQTKCGVGKKKCVAKKLKSLLKCHQKAQTPGVVVEPGLTDCINKAEAKFQGIPDPTKGCIAKLEAKVPNDCLPPLGNTSSLEALVDSCTDAFVALLENPTTTTTSTSTSTTSSTSTSSTSSTSTSSTSTSSTSTSSTSTTSTSSTSTSSTSTSSTSTTSTSSTSTSSTSSTSTSSTSTSSTSTSSTSSTSTSSSSTSSTSSSTTTSTSTSSTTTTVAVPHGMDLTTVISAGTCGNAYSDTTFTTSIKNLACGGLDIGGGSASTPENINPDGTTNRFAITGCVGSSCTLGAYTTAPAVNSATVDCTNTGCNFGSPLPIPVNGAPVCVVNTFSAPVSGTLDTSMGTTTNLSIQLTSAVSLTSNQSQPCPVCKNGSVPASGSPSSPATGLCDRGLRSGLACTSTNSQGLTRDCAPGGSDGSALAGTIPVNLGPLTTGTSSKTSATGIFCTGNSNQTQTTAGCFGASSCRSFKENGSAAGSMTPIGSSHAITLASTFCVPKTGSTLLDFASNLPGPGATTIAATAKLVP